MTAPFFQRLAERARSANSLLCVGLDPAFELGSVAAVREACFKLIDETHEYACAFKPNSAFFEQWGGAGFDALADVIAHVPADIPVILDAKRGDMGNTAEAYARAAFRVLNAGAITLNPYLGQDAIAPFLAYPGAGVFLLCKTSNPSADTLQALRLQDGQLLYESVALIAAAWGSHDQVGLVVGATDSKALQAVRFIAQDTWLLVPGVGAQGGDLEAAVSAGVRTDGLGVLVNASRSIAQAASPRAEAARLRDAINAARIPMPPPYPVFKFKVTPRNLVSPKLDAMSASTGSAPVQPDIRAIASALATSGSVKFGTFTLKSGASSPFYLDLRRLVSYPAALRAISVELAKMLGGLQFDHLVAIPYAALPIGVSTALELNCSLLYPRREVKAYGTGAQIEGVFKPGDSAVLLDDLATTGETKIEAIARLTDAGLKVHDIVVVIDREQGASPMLQKAGYRFHAAATLSALLPHWQELGVLDAEGRSTIERFLADNHV